jgi:hypothetical protein
MAALFNFWLIVVHLVTASARCDKDANTHTNS